MKISNIIFLGFIIVLTACSKVVDNSLPTTGTGGTTTTPTTPATSNPANPSGTPIVPGATTPGTGTPTPVIPPTPPTTPVIPPTTNPGTGGGGSSTGSLGTVTITYTSTPICAPSNERFTFVCNATNVPTGSSYEWYFGDGNTETTTTNTTNNSYSSAGFYTVIVKIKSPTAILATATLGVTAYGQGVTPIASFYAQQPNATTTPNYYTFNSTSTLQKGSIDSYSWNFGDGTTATGSFVTKTFPSSSTSQTFVVTLNIISNSGCTSSKSQTITINPSYTITGGISFTRTSPCAPSREEFSFTGPTSGVPSGAVYSWDFGDNGTAVGNPVTKQYTFPNSYNVRLIITLSNVKLYDVVQSVTSVGQNVTPVTSFDIQQTNNIGAFSFNSKSTVASGSITTYEWDFGNGATATTPFVAYAYTQDVVARSYIVKLTSTSTAGCKTSATQTVNVPAK